MVVYLRISLMIQWQAFSRARLFCRCFSVNTVNLDASSVTTRVDMCMLLHNIKHSSTFSAQKFHATNTSMILENCKKNVRRLASI